MLKWEMKLTSGVTRLYHAMSKETKTRDPARYGIPGVDSSSMLREEKVR